MKLLPNFELFPSVAGAMANGAKVRLACRVAGPAGAEDLAKKGDLGTIRQEKLPRGRGRRTFIDFDDNVKLELKASTPVKLAGKNYLFDETPDGIVLAFWRGLCVLGAEMKGWVPRSNRRNSSKPVTKWDDPVA